MRGVSSVVKIDSAAHMHRESTSSLDGLLIFAHEHSHNWGMTVCMQGKRGFTS